MEIVTSRDVFTPEFTLWKMYVDDSFLGYTCEDFDRHLESGGEKVYGQTAIPRGRYRVHLAYWTKFRTIVPHIIDVPKFTGVYIHGGNRAIDTLGCPLLGGTRTQDGVANCAGVNNHLRDMVEHCEENGEEVWITIR
jgi:hypothetical protein